MQSASQPTTAKNNKDIGRKVAYSFGNVGQSAFYNVLSTYFIVYATSTLFANTDPSVAAKLIGIITGLVVAIRIGEIFLDPLLGNLIDNTNTRFGRFRPWQLAGGIVSAILLVVIFTGLFGLVNVNTTAFMVLFVITFILLDVFYSIRDISYWGMVPALSSDSKERSVFTAMASFGGTIGYHGITIIVIPVVSFFTWKFSGTWTEGQSGWTAFAIIAAILAILTSMSVAFGAKESTSELRSKEQKSGTPLDAFKAIAQNDQLLWVALSYLLYAVANVATSGVMFYLFKFVLDMPTQYSLVGVVPIFVGLIAAPLYPVLNRFIPRRYLFLGGTTMMIIAYVIFILASNSLPIIVTALIFFYTPGVFIQMTAILGLTDSIEYGQLKNGKRNEAVTLSVRPMLDKTAGAFSNGIVGFIAVAAGMTGSATAADMTSSNIQTFNVFAFYIPLALIVASMLIYMFKVKIDEKSHAEMVRELERRLASENVDDVDGAPVEAAATIAANDELVRELENDSDFDDLDEHGRKKSSVITAD